MAAKSRPVAKTATNGTGKLTADQVIAFLEALDKGSEILKRAKHSISRKLSAKPLDDDVLKVLREMVALKSYDVVRRCWSEVRREQPKPVAKVAAQMEAS